MTVDMLGVKDVCYLSTLEVPLASKLVVLYVGSTDYYVSHCQP